MSQGRRRKEDWLEGRVKNNVGFVESGEVVFAGQAGDDAGDGRKVGMELGSIQEG